MAVTKIHKTSRIVMYITMAITIVVMALFFLGGEVPVDQRLVPTAPEPKYIDLLMYWVYFLVGCTVLVLLAFAIADFFIILEESTQKGYQFAFGHSGICSNVCYHLHVGK